MRRCRAHLIRAVTGVLLTDGKRFFQYIEGPEDGVAAAYTRRPQPHGHRGTGTQLGRGPALLVLVHALVPSLA